jgi:hypothetical protein
VWSGGMDSTAIVLQQIESKQPFITQYFNLKNNIHKSAIESYTRQRIRRTLTNNYNLNDIWFYEQSYNLSMETSKEWIHFDKNRKDYISNPPTGNWMYYQQPLWMIGLLQSITGLQIDRILLGYIREYSYWLDRPFFEEGFYNFYKGCTGGQKPPDLVYLFKYDTK